MNSTILNTATNYLLPLLLVFSVFLLFRGHNEPGGGFAGGLVAASAIALYAIASSGNRAKQLLRVEPRTLIGLGLLIAVASGFPAVFLGMDFMTGVWDDTPIPVIGKFGTPLLFDIGVYLVVIGITLTIVLTLKED